MSKETINMSRYFLLSIFLLLVVGGIGLYTNKIDDKKQKQNYQNYLEMHFDGNVKGLKRVSRGVVLQLDSMSVTLGMRGVPLIKQISSNDSIVKHAGDANIYLFKKNEQNVIIDTVIIWN